MIWFFLNLFLKNFVSIKLSLIFAKFARREKNSMNQDFVCQNCFLIDELNSLHFFSKCCECENNIIDVKKS
jgi:hypothetical protein